MSMMTSVASVVKTLMAPLVPAGTMAALATTVPVGALSVETTGICASPVGQTVR